MGIAASRGVSFDFDERPSPRRPAAMDARLDRSGWRRPAKARGAAGGARGRAGRVTTPQSSPDAGVPAAMVFVRNANGSHNPREAMEIGDFLAGVDLLTAALTEAPH